MNERIKQLWEDNDTIEVCYPEQGSPVSVSATTLEKFAELIVAETISVLQKRFMGDLNREDMEVRKCIEDVKTHFAVKE